MEFVDVVNTPGACAIGPLLDLKTGGSVFYAAWNGSPILKMGQWGPESSFSSEQAALDFANFWGAARGLKPGPCTLKVDDEPITILVEQSKRDADTVINAARNGRAA